MKKYFLTFIILFTGLFFSMGQQDPQFSQYYFTQLGINPAYAGSEDKICAYALQRLQWTNFEGAPSTTVFNADGAIKRFGLGISLLNDEFGFDKNFKVNLSISYKFPISTGNLAVGIKWGVANSSINLSDGGWITPTDPANQDIAIPENGDALSYMDFGFGIYYKTPDLYLGISSTQLLNTEFEHSKLNAANETVTVNTSLKRHYYLTAGYNMPFSNPLLEFKPSVLVQSDGKNSQLALTGLITYNKKLWGGVSLRTDNAIIGILGAELFKWVKISYSYDFVVSDLMGYNNGTHEIMMGFCLDVKKDKTPERYKSIRFL